MTEKEICKRFYKHLLDNHIVESPFDEDSFEEYIYFNYKGEHSDKNSDIDNISSESEPYQCYNETQSPKGRCKEWCENSIYCERSAVCSNWTPGAINYAICQHCGHAKPQHEQTEN